MKRLALGSFLVLAASISMAVPASAKDKDKKGAPPSPLVTAIDRCRQMTDPTQRLACYDSAASALVTTANSGAVTVVDQNDIRQARHSLFGFNLPHKIGRASCRERV